MNWHDLIEDVRIELGLLHQLVDEAGDLVTAVKTKRDRPTEHLAAGAVLQSFYNGVEQVLAMLADRIDGARPDGGDNPRQALFDAMCRAGDNRPAVLEPELAAALKRCLDFREAFRYAQFFHLNWEQTAPLVIDLPRMLGVFETRIDAFISDASGEPARLASEQTDLPRYWSQPIKVKTVRVEKKPTIILCVMAVAFGAITGFIMTRKRYAPYKPESIPAKVIDKYAFTVDGEFKVPQFRAPGGEIVELALRDRGNPFMVTVEKTVENSDELLTGRMDRRGPTPRSRPALTLHFHEGEPIFFQAITEKGEFQRGYFRDRKLMQFDQCRPDGMPYKRYHLTTAQQTACKIEQGTFAADAHGKGGYEGWYYTFYHEGRPAAEMFITDDGLLLKSDVWGLESDDATPGPIAPTGPSGSTTP